MKVGRVYFAVVLVLGFASNNAFAEKGNLEKYIDALGPGGDVCVDYDRDISVYRVVATGDSRGRSWGRDQPDFLAGINNYYMN